MSIVNLMNITKKYNNKTVLDSFTFSINEGDMLTISGKSGSGKSTLLNIIGLIDENYEGNLTLNGETNPTKNYKQALDLRRYFISYIFQNYALINNQSVEENLKLALKYSNEKNNPKIISEVLEKVYLKDMKDKIIYQLSGGEKQRVAIARTIIKPCKLILADEPTGSLDEYNRQIILDLLQELNKQGKTIVIVTHDKYIVNKINNNIELQYQ